MIVPTDAVGQATTQSATVTVAPLPRIGEYRVVVRLVGLDGVVSGKKTKRFTVLPRR